MIRRFAAASAALMVFCQLCACSHGNAIACEPTSRYSTAATIGPVRIPDDLNPPDDTDSLRLPPDTGRVAQSSKACLETPPGFYADGAPSNPRGGTPQRRGGGAPAPAPRQAAPPPTAAPAPTTPPAPAESPPVPASVEASPPVPVPALPSTDEPPAGGDREITN